MTRNLKVFQGLSEDLQEIDLEDLEAPRYLEKLDLPVKREKKPVRALIEDIWVPQPELVEKSLEQLEQQDKLYRSNLSVNTEHEKAKATQLNLQRTLYKEILQLGLKIHTLPSFVSLPEYESSVKTVLKSLINLQNKLGPFSDGSLKSIESTCMNVWEWMAGLAREWSSRVDLKIGADIVDQVLREAEKKTDYDIQLHMLRELKSENSSVQHSTNKKPKHKFSKHRKLKFDVHEKLQNFMTPDHARWDSKHETLLKSLFGKKTDNGEKVYLDIPLV